MTVSIDWPNKTVLSSASLTDLPAFHAELRAFEDDVAGAIYPTIHTWKALDLGGAFFYQADFINGWQLKFPNPGNYTIVGNLNTSIVGVAGVYVERKTSAAFSTTTIGGSGPSANDIATAVRIELAAELAKISSGTINADIRKVNNVSINGVGTDGDPWRAL
jgi:hypothetical protein